MRGAWALLLVLANCAVAGAQAQRGQVLLQVTDPQGAPLSAAGELSNHATQYQRAFTTDSAGHARLADLGYGVYIVTLRSEGFALQTVQVAVNSALPVNLAVRMQVATVQTEVVVPAVALLDPAEPSVVATIPEAEIANGQSAQVGRRLIDLVADQPGWLFEQNGVLHPRESEYDVLFVLNGVPIPDNQSPAFAPGLESNDVETMQVRTAGFAAEYGRSLGGVVDVTTRRQPDLGWHGEASALGGSFATAGGDAHVGYNAGRAQTALSAEGARTDRYLDPPVTANFTNDGARENFQIEQGWQAREQDSLYASFLVGRVANALPNNFAQQQNGQRQNQTLAQTGGIFSWQHIASPALLWQVHAELRDASASLGSNALSTPLVVQQERGFREGYLGADVSKHAAASWGTQEWKAGADAVVRHVHEQLSYVVTDPSQFEPGTAPAFAFFDRAWDVEPGFYLEDTLHAHAWNLAAGLRADVYRFVVHQSALSPRLSLSRAFVKQGLLFHVSYDRVFQAPAVANLLLASSPQAQSLNIFVERLPVKPASANYYEAGASKVFGSVLRADLSVFRRDFRNYPDDDTLLSTGISFPIADSRARITGEEVSLQLRDWHRVSGFVSYANQSGIAAGPITGGLFLGNEGIAELATSGTFAVSQDQRNTLRTQLRFAPSARVGLMARYRFNSGLPAELDEPVNIADLQQQYGAGVVAQVNFARQRVRPSRSLDAGANVALLARERRTLDLLLQVENIENHLNVINFASLFSGTGIAPPRSAQATLRFAF